MISAVGIAVLFGGVLWVIWALIERLGRRPGGHGWVRWHG